MNKKSLHISFWLLRLRLGLGVDIAGIRCVNNYVKGLQWEFFRIQEALYEREKPRWENEGKSSLIKAWT